MSYSTVALTDLTIQATNYSALNQPRDFLPSPVFSQDKTNKANLSPSDASLLRVAYGICLRDILDGVGSLYPIYIVHST